jgi:5-methylthioadenosine/S-adenosylhomocysteine deaminase
MDDATGLLGARLAVAEAVKAGTTTFGEFGRRPDLLIPLIEEVGIRAQLTVTIREAVERIYNPGELYEFDAARGQRMLETCLDVFNRFNHAADGRITVLFGPQGPDFVSRELLLRIQQLARERKTKIHMHTQQGDRETAQIMMRYEKRPIAWLDEIGYLDEGLIAVHLTDADENEAQLVARRGAAMALCSGSIGIIDGVVPPARAFQEAGGMVALGSDQAPGNNNHNMINEMKLTALFNKIRYQDPEIMPAWRVLRMATIEGARALGLDATIGSLTAGKQADFILVDLKRPTLAPVYTEPMRNIVPNLVYSGRGDEVSLVAVDGRIIYENGRLVHLDESEVVSAVQEAAERLGPKAAEEFWKVNGTNARFMTEGKL